MSFTEEPATHLCDTSWAMARSLRLHHRLEQRPPNRPPILLVGAPSYPIYNRKVLYHKSKLYTVSSDALVTINYMPAQYSACLPDALLPATRRGHLDHGSTLGALQTATDTHTKSRIYGFKLPVHIVSRETSILAHLITSPSVTHASFSFTSTRHRQETRLASSPSSTAV
jgi:hypothetical protein